MARKRLLFGFTLIELMITVAIVGLLAAIAIPRFAEMIIKSKEAATAGRLGSYRSAITLYYSDNEGIYPADFAHAEMASLTPKYINELPEISIPRFHEIFSAHTHVENTPLVRGDFTQSFAPLFHPAPVAYAFDVGTGRLWINCTHTTSKGVLWSTL